MKIVCVCVLFQFYIIRGYKWLSLRKFHGIMDAFFFLLYLHCRTACSYLVCEFVCATRQRAVISKGFAENLVQCERARSGSLDPMTKVWKYCDDFVRTGLSLWICFFFLLSAFFNHHKINPITFAVETCNIVCFCWCCCHCSFFGFSNLNNEW